MYRMCIYFSWNEWNTHLLALHICVLGKVFLRLCKHKAWYPMATKMALTLLDYTLIKTLTSWKLQLLPQCHRWILVHSIHSYVSIVNVFKASCLYLQYKRLEHAEKSQSSNRNIDKCSGCASMSYSFNYIVFQHVPEWTRPWNKHPPRPGPFALLNVIVD